MVGHRNDDGTWVWSDIEFATARRTNLCPHEVRALLMDKEISRELQVAYQEFEKSGHSPGRPEIVKDCQRIWRFYWRFNPSMKEFRGQQISTKNLDDLNRGQSLLSMELRVAFFCYMEQRFSHFRDYVEQNFPHIYLKEDDPDDGDDGPIAA